VHSEILGAYVVAVPEVVGELPCLHPVESWLTYVKVCHDPLRIPLILTCFLGEKGRKHDSGKTQSVDFRGSEMV